MFARIVKSSIKSVLKPSLIRPSFNHVYKFPSSPLTSYVPFNSFSTSNLSQTNIQSILKEFSKKQIPTARDILKVLDTLESSKINISSSDPVYKDFLMRLNDSVKNKLDPESLEAIAIKAYNLNIKETLFWFSLDNTIKTSEDVDFGTLLVISSILLRVKAYPQFGRYLSGNKQDFLEAAKKSLSDLDFRRIIHASYIFASLDMPFPELTKRLKNDLKSSLKNLDAADVSINDLATAAILISTVVKDNDSDKTALLNGLGQYLASKDLNQFLAQPSAKEKEDYIDEVLNWHSTAFLVRVYCSSEFYNERLVAKLNEAILKKRETDFIDFESASIILSVLSQSQEANSNVVQGILEMVHTQLANEGSAMFTQFDGRNVIAFMKATISLAKKGKSQDIIGEFLEYFAGLVQSDKIATKIELEDLELLKRQFEEAKAITQIDANVFSHIEKRKAYIMERKKKEKEGKQ